MQVSGVYFTIWWFKLLKVTSILITIIITIMIIKQNKTLKEGKKNQGLLVKSVQSDLATPDIIRIRYSKMSVLSRLSS